MAIWICNDTAIAENANRVQSNTSRIENTTHRLGNKRRYEIICPTEHNENEQIIAEEVNVHIDWGG